MNNKCMNHQQIYKVDLKWYYAYNSHCLENLPAGLIKISKNVLIFAVRLVKLALTGYW